MKYLYLLIQRRNKVLLSRSVADKLSLKVGDKLYTYFVDRNVRVRRLTISGIYQTNLSYYDDLFLVTDLYTVNRLNSWKTGQVGGLEVSVSDYRNLDKVNDRLRFQLEDAVDDYGEIYCSRTVEEVYPQIFDWLNLLDVNVWVILIYDRSFRLYHDIRLIDYYLGADEYDWSIKGIRGR